MALCPSYAMAMALPEKERPLPILKVLYRTSTHIHGARCTHEDRLADVGPTKIDDTTPAAIQMRDAARARKLAQAEQIFVSLPGTPEQTYDDVQLLIQDDLNVHRVVLGWRGGRRGCCGCGPGRCWTSSARTTPATCSARPSASAPIRGTAGEGHTPSRRCC